MEQAVTDRLAVWSVLKSRILQNIFYHLEKFFSCICVITALWSRGSVAVSGSHPVLFHISMLDSLLRLQFAVHHVGFSNFSKMAHLVWRSFSSPAEAVSRVPFTEVCLVFVSFSCFCLIFSVYSLVNVTFLPVNQAHWSVNQCICMNADTAGRNHGSEELHLLTTIRVFFESKETSDRQRDTMGRGQTVLSVCWRFSPAAASRCSRAWAILVLCK